MDTNDDNQSLWSMCDHSKATQTSLATVSSQRNQPYGHPMATKPMAVSMPSNSQPVMSRSATSGHSLTTKQVTKRFVTNHWSQRTNSASSGHGLWASGTPLPTSELSVDTQPLATSGSQSVTTDRQLISNLIDRQLVTEMDRQLTDFVVQLADIKAMINEWPIQVVNSLSELLAQELSDNCDESSVEFTPEVNVTKESQTEPQLSAQLIQCADDWKQYIDECLQQTERSVELMVDSKITETGDRLDSLYVKQIEQNLDLIENNIKYNETDEYYEEDIDWFDGLTVGAELELN